MINAQVEDKQLDIIQVDFVDDENSMLMQQNIEEGFLALMRQISGNQELKIVGVEESKGDDGQIHRLQPIENGYRYTVDIAGIGNGVGFKAIERTAEIWCECLNNLG